MMAVSGGKILVIKNSRCPRWEYLFHDLKSPVCFACCLSSSQNPGETEVKPEAGSVSHAGLFSKRAFLKQQQQQLPFIEYLLDWCLCMLMPTLTPSLLVAMLNSSFRRSLENFKWFFPRLQSYSRARVGMRFGVSVIPGPLILFTPCEVAETLDTYNHMEREISFQIKMSYTLLTEKEIFLPPGEFHTKFRSVGSQHTYEHFAEKNIFFWKDL